MNIRMVITNYAKLVKEWFIYKNIRRYETIDGFLTLSDAMCLYRTARKLMPGSTVVEIGSWKGKSTYCLAQPARRSGDCD